MLTVELLPRFKAQPVIFVMGVSGCGKSSVGNALAIKIGKVFIDADDYHPQANIDKMASGVALTDVDRIPWLHSLAKVVSQKAKNNGGVVCACSALKKRYRDILRSEIDNVVLFILLDGQKEILSNRLMRRSNHYMPPSLLESQLSVLEKPSDDEFSINVSIEKSIEKIVKEIVSTLDLELA